MITSSEKYLLFWWRMLSDEEQEAFIVQIDDYERYPEYVTMLDIEGVANGDINTTERERHPKIAQATSKVSTSAN